MGNQPEVRQQMFEMIEQWRASNLSQKAFCEERSIRYYVFHYWYKRYHLAHSTGTGSGTDKNNSSFVKLQIAKPSVVGSVEIHFPGGVRLLFHEPVSSNYLRALIS